MIFEEDGRALYYELAGEGPYVTLIHGVGSRADDWDAVIDCFWNRFRVLKFDLRGHGRSGRIPGPYRAEDFAADLAALLDHLAIEQTHVVGFSLGGLVAQAFALGYPARVGKLALVSAVAGRTPEERERVRERLSIIDQGIPTAHFDRSVTRWFTEEFRAAHPEAIEARKRAFETNDPVSYGHSYRVLVETDFADRLHEIGHKTLVMTGEFDQGSNPRMARLMHERIERSSLIILPRLRHSILLEGGDIVGGILREFLTGP